MNDLPPEAAGPPDRPSGRHRKRDRTAQIAALVAELRKQGIRDERVLAAMAVVPRERFVPPSLAAEAWRNVALPIGAGQTISQPYIVALMSAALGLSGGERVLEIGTGSGYQTAILAELVGPRGFIISVERHGMLATGAAARLADLGYANVAVHLGDGSLGLAAAAPFERIIVTASGPEVPQSLLDQLDPAGGRLVMPVGRHNEQQDLLAIERTGPSFQRHSLGPVRFVPLVGRAGWAAVRENGHRR